MSFSDFLENALLNHTFGGGDFTRPASVQVGLSSTAPTDAGGNITEPSGNGYARVTVTNNSTNFPAASGGSKSNGAEIAFPESTGAWLAGDPLTHFVIWNADGSEVLGKGALGTSRVVDAAGITLRFAAGQLTITLD